MTLVYRNIRGEDVNSQELMHRKAYILMLNENLEENVQPRCAVGGLNSNKCWPSENLRNTELCAMPF